MKPLNSPLVPIWRHARAGKLPADTAAAGSSSISRRAFTAASLALALAGCAGTPDEPVSTGHGGGHADGGFDAGADPAAPDPAAGDTVETAHAPVPPTLPSRDAIAAAFNGRPAGQWGLQLPGVQSHLPAASTGPLLTFDCCGGGPAGNGVDLALIDALTKAGAPAVFFLNSRWIQANPGPAKALGDNPLFEIGNHGTRHIPLSVSGRSAYGIPGTASPVEVYDEVMPNQDTIFKLTGRTARLFRPGTAFYDDASVAIVRELGLVPLGFSINGDGGATFPAATVTREVTTAKAGDVVICHANRPAGGTSAGITRALADFHNRGLQPVRFAS